MQYQALLDILQADAPVPLNGKVWFKSWTVITHRDPEIVLIHLDT